MAPEGHRGREEATGDPRVPLPPEDLGRSLTRGPRRPATSRFRIRLPRDRNAAHSPIDEGRPCERPSRSRSAGASRAFYGSSAVSGNVGPVDDLA